MDGINSIFINTAFMTNLHINWSIVIQVQRDIIAIPKTVNKNRLIENMNIFDFTLSDDDMAAIFSLEKEGGAGRGCAELDAKGHKYYPFNTEF